MVYGDEYFAPDGDVMGYDDVMGLSLNPLNWARSGLRMVPGLNQLPGIRRGGGRPAARFPTGAMMRPMGNPMAPYPYPPLPMGQSMPTARLRSFLGMGVVTYGAADAGIRSLQNTLQESFRPERLIVERSFTGTPAGLTVVQAVFAGTMPQSPSIASGTPTSMFAANATYSAVDMQIVWRGTQLTVQLNRDVVPGAGNTETFAVGFYGQWLR